VDALGDTYVLSCPGPASIGEPALPPYRWVLVFDPAHRLIGAWYDSPFTQVPVFGPGGYAYSLGPDGSVLKLKVVLPGA